MLSKGQIEETRRTLKKLFGTIPAQLAQLLASHEELREKLINIGCQSTGRDKLCGVCGPCRAEN